MAYFHCWTDSKPYGYIVLLPSATKFRRFCFHGRVSVNGGGGVCLTACWDTNPAPRPGRYPPGPHTPGKHPPQEAHPLEAHPLGSTPLPRETPPPKDPADAADGTHPTGMHSCVEYVSTGRTWTLIRIQLLFPNGYCTHLRHGSLFQTNT